MEFLTWEDFKLWLNERFMLHNLVFKDGMEFLKLAQGDMVGYLVSHVQDFNQILTMVPMKEEYAKKLIFLHGLKPWV